MSTETTNPGLLYHESIDHLRRDLVTEAMKFRDEAKQFAPTSLAKASPMHNAAYLGSLMAGLYGYTLAAVLGYAAQKFGPEVARTLANFADDVIENGDDNGVNDDVMPA